MTIRLPDTIRGRLPYLLSKAYARQMALFERHTAAFEVTVRDYGVMLLLEAHDALWQSQIADTLGLDRTTVTYLIDGLEAKQRVARHRDANDRRAFVVSLTETGRQTLADLGPVVRQAADEFLGPLNPAEQDQLRALLGRLTEQHA